MPQTSEETYSTSGQWRSQTSRCPSPGRICSRESPMRSWYQRPKAGGQWSSCSPYQSRVGATTSRG